MRRRSHDEVPHLADARCGIDAQVARRVLAHVRDVVMLLSRDRMLRFANPAARQLLARKDPIRISKGRVATTSPSHSVALERAIDRVCSRGAGDEEVLVLHRTADFPLVLSIRCVDPASGDIILVVGTDPHVEPAKVRSSLKRCFGLTSSEAEVAAAIAAGRSSASIAGSRGVRLNTIRTQIKSIAAKLGCASQSQISAIVRATPVSADAPH